MHLESSPNVCWCAPAVLVMQLLSSSVRSHLIFIRHLSHVVFIRPTQSIFQYSFFVCILLPIISNILVCAILLTYSAITSGDKTCVTFCLDIAVVSLTLNIMWICVSIICVRYEHSSLSLLHWHLPTLFVSFICGNVKYRN